MGGLSVDSETIASWELSWCQSSVEFPCLRRWLMNLWCRCRASPPHDVRHRFASKPSHAIAWSTVWASAPSMPQQYCDEYWIQFVLETNTQTKKQNKPKRKPRLVFSCELHLDSVQRSSPLENRVVAWRLRLSVKGNAVCWYAQGQWKNRLCELSAPDSHRSS